LSLAQSHPARLLTTRARAAVGAVVTAYVFALGIREQLRPTRAGCGWLITTDGWLPGRLVTVLNVGFYAVFWWGGFWLIRGNQGRERLFMVGWFTFFLLSPLRTLGPQWCMTVNYIDRFGLLVALVVAISLVLRPVAIHPRS
jgi:hypothetical protein